MKYLKSYLQALWTLIGYFSAFFLVVATLLYIFTPYRLSPLVGFYFVYVAVVAAFGGVVRVGMK